MSDLLTQALLQEVRALAPRAYHPSTWPAYIAAVRRLHTLRSLNERIRRKVLHDRPS
jgi:hypothetical protein